MNVTEVLQFQPKKPSVKRGREDDSDEEAEDGRREGSRGASGGGGYLSAKRPAMGLSEEEKQQILDAADEIQAEAMNETALKKMILLFERRFMKNQEMRIKFFDAPEKFMTSEVELNDIIQEMHVIATVPDLYQIVVDLNAIHSLLQLLSHDNTDISIAVVDLLQEMTDVDALAESEDGMNVLMDALIESQVTALLVQNIERLDETVKEESEGVHNTLGIFENMTELRPEFCIEAAQQGLMAWLLKRIKLKMAFEGNKLYCSELLSILLQNHNETRKQLGEMDGIDILLQQLAVYKRHDPHSPEEIEFMENLFTCVCSCLMYAPNRERFLKGEGLQLMNLLIREKKMSRLSAIKVLNHAMSGTEGADNCQKFVDILGLRSIFPLFMKPPKKHKKGGGPSTSELEEHLVSIIASMMRNCSSTQRQRLLNKFSENDHEKIDRLMELHFKYLRRVQVADEKIEKEKYNIRIYGGEIDAEHDEAFYLQRLDAGLFTLQFVDYIMLEVCNSGASSMNHRVRQILNMRGGSTKSIRHIIREYAGNVGDAMEEDARKEEQDRILALLDNF